MAHRGLQIRGLPKLHSKARVPSALNTDSFLLVIIPETIKYNSSLGSSTPLQEARLVC